MMSTFESLFGIIPEEVKRNCLLVPLLSKGFLKNFGIEKLNRGFLYASGQGTNFTLIQTGMGAGLVGDAVLYLKETNCKNLLLFGSCGALNNNTELQIGSLVYPEKCSSFESFSDFLGSPSRPPQIYFPDKSLRDSFLKETNCADLRPVHCATVASLKLEEEKDAWLIEQGIDVVDMECSAFFSASKHAEIPALALFYIADIVNQKPFYVKSSDLDQQSLLQAIDKASNILVTFLNQKN